MLKRVTEDNYCALIKNIAKLVEDDVLLVLICFNTAS